MTGTCRSFDFSGCLRSGKTPVRTARTSIALDRVFVVLFAVVLLANVAARPGYADQGPSGFVLHEKPRQIADVAFVDGDGRQMTLGEFRGRFILLNLWATWCAPCRIEMPTLDRLRENHGDARFDVLALSIDRAGVSVVRRFYEQIGVRSLAIHIDPSARAARSLGVLGLPTTLLLDPQGREVGRLVGPAEWDSPEMVRFLLAQASSAETGKDQ